jgi:class 3 adenylate cyclase
MAVYQAPQNVLPRFLLSLFAAAGALLFLYFFLSGPRLGPHYDYLTRYRAPPPVSRELVIIETSPAAGFIETVTLTGLLMTLVELDTRALAVQTPILGVAAHAGPAEDELAGRLSEEFTLLARNIRNLFEAIRMGSVSPAEAEQYVDGLIGLSEQGKERLLSVLIRKDDAGTRRMEQAAAVFGNVWEAGDVRLSSGGAESPPRYSRSTLDPDGVFRRIYPLRPGPEPNGEAAEHVVYAMLNHAFGPAAVERRDGMPHLRFKREGFDRDIALDSRGAALVELPRGGEAFKRLSLEDFARYEETDRELALLLDALEERGFFAHLRPESYPALLYNHAHRLREELLESAGGTPPADLKARWLDARGEYLRSLDDFAAGPSEADLVMDYETLIAGENITAAELRRLVSARNDAISAFSSFREKYAAFLRIREALSSALAGSFCILGPAHAPAGPEAEPADTGAAPGGLARLLPRVRPEPVPTDAEAAAVLGNTILSGRAVALLPGRYTLLWSLLTVLLTLFLVRRQGPVPTLITGVFMAALAAAVFCCGFVFTQYWADPLIPAGSAAAGTLASFLCAVAVKRKNTTAIRRIYGTAVAPEYLGRLVKAGLPGEVVRAKAAIVAIRLGGLLAAESAEDPLDSAVKTRAFRETAARRFTRIGGVVVGMDGDLILIAFGSPAERAATRRGKTAPPCGRDNPEASAVGFTLDFLAETPEAASWRFGIDSGDCAFSCTELSGYTASGRPVVRSRILSGLASRYHARILISARVSERIEGFLTRRLDALTGADGKDRETFYEVIHPRTGAPPPP